MTGQRHTVLLFPYYAAVLEREQEPLVALVCFVYMVEPEKSDEPDKPQTKQADVFNSLYWLRG
jgi:hypothetical protein